MPSDKKGELITFSEGCSVWARWQRSQEGSGYTGTHEGAYWMGRKATASKNVTLAHAMEHFYAEDSTRFQIDNFEVIDGFLTIFGRFCDQQIRITRLCSEKEKLLLFERHKSENFAIGIFLNAHSNLYRSQKTVGGKSLHCWQQSSTIAETGQVNGESNR
jgi:hypothetical protein